MDLKTLHESLGKLLEQGIEGTEAVCLQLDNTITGTIQCEVKGVAVTVSSDLWMADTVVITAHEIEDD
jgi:hypothetical protein